MKKKTVILICVLIIFGFAIVKSFLGFINRDAVIESEQTLYIADGIKIVSASIKGDDCKEYFCNDDITDFVSVEKMDDYLICSVRFSDGNYRDEKDEFGVIKVFEDNRYEEIFRTDFDCHFFKESGQFLYYIKDNFNRESWEHIGRLMKYDMVSGKFSEVIDCIIDFEKGISYTADNNILYVTENEIHLLSTDGEDKTLIEGKYPIWNEDNKSFFYMTKDKLWLYDLDHKQSELVNKNIEAEEPPILSKDKKYIIYYDEDTPFLVYERPDYYITIKPLEGRLKKRIYHTTSSWSKSIS